MRANNREAILEGVVRILQRDGMTAVTFDAVAAETGLTRGGLLYHFPSREALLLATHKHLAQTWEARLEALSPKPRSEAARQVAYVLSCAEVPTRAELLMMLEGVGDEQSKDVWNDTIDRWAPPLPDEDDPSQVNRFLARMAADGLWFYQAQGHAVPAKLKDAIRSALIALMKAG